MLTVVGEGQTTYVVFWIGGEPHKFPDDRRVKPHESPDDYRAGGIHAFGERIWRRVGVDVLISG